MAAGNVTGVYNLAGAKEQFRDGGGHSLLCYLTQGSLAITVEGPKVEEAMQRGRHLPGQAPVLVETGDGNVPATMSFELDDLPIGTTADSSIMSTWLDAVKARNAGLVSTVRGGAWAFEVRLVVTHQGSTKTIILPYCRPANLKMDPGGDNGKMMCSFDVTNHGTSPIILDGEVL